MERGQGCPRRVSSIRNRATSNISVHHHHPVSFNFPQRRIQLVEEPRLLQRANIPLRTPLLEGRVNLRVVVGEVWRVEGTLVSVVSHCLPQARQSAWRGRHHGCCGKKNARRGRGGYGGPACEAPEAHRRRYRCDDDLLLAVTRTLVALPVGCLSPCSAIASSPGDICLPQTHPPISFARFDYFF